MKNLLLNGEVYDLYLAAYAAYSQGKDGPKVPRITPRCHDQNMVPRNGRYGDFWGCPTFPTCTNTQNGLDYDRRGLYALARAAAETNQMEAPFPATAESFFRDMEIALAVPGEPQPLKVLRIGPEGTDSVKSFEPYDYVIQERSDATVILKNRHGKTGSVGLESDVLHAWGVLNEVIYRSKDCPDCQMIMRDRGISSYVQEIRETLAGKKAWLTELGPRLDAAERSPKKDSKAELLTLQRQLSEDISGPGSAIKHWDEIRQAVRSALANSVQHEQKRQALVGVLQDFAMDLVQTVNQYTPRPDSALGIALRGVRNIASRMLAAADSANVMTPTASTGPAPVARNVDWK